MTKQDQKMLLIAALVGGGILIYNSSKKAEPEFEYEDEPVVPVVTPIKPPAQQQLNPNLVLRKGSKGAEVVQLQKLLNISVDGVFGQITENTLFALKGVKEISLAGFPKKVNVNHNALAVGTRIMAYKKPTIVYANQTLANGTYYNTGKVSSEFQFGLEVGTIIAVTNDKINYIVKSGFFNTIVWVRAADVVKM